MTNGPILIDLDLMGSDEWTPTLAAAGEGLSALSAQTDALQAQADALSGTLDGIAAPLASVQSGAEGAAASVGQLGEQSAAAGEQIAGVGEAATSAGGGIASYAEALGAMQTAEADAAETAAALAAGLQTEAAVAEQAGAANSAAAAQTSQLAAANESGAAAAEAHGASLESAAMGATLLGGATVYATAKALELSDAYDQAMLKVQDFAGVSQSQMAAVSQQVLQLSIDTGTSATNVANGLYYVKSAGFDTASSMQILADTTRVATAAGVDASTVADVTTSALRSYGQGADQTNAVLDTLIGTVSAGKMQFSDLASSLGRVLPVAAEMGISLDQVGASIATMTQKGMSSDEAVTALRGTILALSAPTKQTQTELAQMGVSADEVRQSIADKGLLATLDDLYAKTGGNIDALKDLVPNVRALVGVLSLASDGGAAYAQVLGQVQSANGDAAKTWEDYTQTTQYSLDKLKSSIEVGLVETFAAVGQAAAPVVGAITDVATAVDHLEQSSPIVKDVFAGLLTLGAGAGALALTGGALGLIFSQLEKVSEFARPLADLGTSTVVLTDAITEQGAAAGAAAVETDTLATADASLAGDAGLAATAESGLAGSEGIAGAGAAVGGIAAGAGEADLALGGAGALEAAGAAADVTGALLPLGIALGVAGGAVALFSTQMDQGAKSSQAYKDGLQSVKDELDNIGKTKGPGAALDATNQIIADAQAKLGSTNGEIARVQAEMSGISAQSGTTIGSVLDATSSQYKADDDYLKQLMADQQKEQGILDQAKSAQGGLAAASNESFYKSLALDEADAADQARSYTGYAQAVNTVSTEQASILTRAASAFANAGVAVAEHADAESKLDALTQQANKSSGDRQTILAAEAIAYQAVTGPADQLATVQANLTDMQKNGDDAQKAYATDALNMIGIYQNLAGPTHDYAAAQNEVNDALNGTVSTGPLAVGVLRDIYNAMNDVAQKSKELDPLGTALDKLNLQIDTNQAEIDKWNATVANSSQIDQRIAALQKQLDTEQKTGASTQQVTKTQQDLALQLAAVSAAEGQAIVAGQQHIDSLSDQNTALRGNQSVLQDQQSVATATAKVQQDQAALGGKAYSDAATSITGSAGVIAAANTGMSSGTETATTAMGRALDALAQKYADTANKIGGPAGIIARAFSAEAAGLASQAGGAAGGNGGSGSGGGSLPSVSGGSLGSIAAQISSSGRATPEQMAQMLLGSGFQGSQQDLATMVAILMSESGGSLTAGSPAGAYGIGQLMPGFDGISNAARTGTDPQSIIAQFAAIVGGYLSAGGIAGFNASPRGGPWDPYAFRGGGNPAVNYGEVYVGPGQGSYLANLPAAQAAVQNVAGSSAVPQQTPVTTSTPAPYYYQLTPDQVDTVASQNGMSIDQYEALTNADQQKLWEALVAKYPGSAKPEAGTQTIGASKGASSASNAPAYNAATQSFAAPTASSSPDVSAALSAGSSGQLPVPEPDTTGANSNPIQDQYQAKSAIQSATEQVNKNLDTVVKNPALLDAANQADAAWAKFSADAQTYIQSIGTAAEAGAKKQMDADQAAADYQQKLLDDGVTNYTAAQQQMLAVAQQGFDQASAALNDALNPSSVNAQRDALLAGLAQNANPMDLVDSIFGTTGGQLTPEQAKALVSVVQAAEQAVVSSTTLTPEQKAAQEGQLAGFISTITPSVGVAGSVAAAQSAATKAGSAAQKAVTDATSTKSSGNAAQIGQQVGQAILDQRWGDVIPLLLSDSLEIGDVETAAQQYITQHAQTAQETANGLTNLAAGVSGAAQISAPNLALIDTSDKSNFDLGYQQAKSSGHGLTDYTGLERQIADLLEQYEVGGDKALYQKAVQLLISTGSDAEKVGDAVAGLIKSDVGAGVAGAAKAQDVLGQVGVDVGVTQYKPNKADQPLTPQQLEANRQQAVKDQDQFQAALNAASANPNNPVVRAGSQPLPGQLGVPLAAPYTEIPTRNGPWLATPAQVVAWQTQTQAFAEAARALDAFTQRQQQKLVIHVQATSVMNSRVVGYLTSEAAGDQAELAGRGLPTNGPVSGAQVQFTAAGSGGIYQNVSG